MINVGIRGRQETLKPMRDELKQLQALLRERYVGKHFKSREIADALGLKRDQIKWRLDQLTLYDHRLAEDPDKGNTFYYLTEDEETLGQDVMELYEMFLPRKSRMTDFDLGKVVA